MIMKLNHEAQGFIGGALLLLGIILTAKYVEVLRDLLARR